LPILPIQPIHTHTHTHPHTHIHVHAVIQAYRHRPTHTYVHTHAIRSTHPPLYKTKSLFSQQAATWKWQYHLPTLSLSPLLHCLRAHIVVLSAARRPHPTLHGPGHDLSREKNSHKNINTPWCPTVDAQSGVPHPLRWTRRGMSGGELTQNNCVDKPADKAHGCIASAPAQPPQRHGTALHIAFARVPDLAIKVQEVLNSIHTGDLIEGAVDCSMV
jgi:hypothetical protein